MASRIHTGSLELTPLSNTLMHRALQVKGVPGVYFLTAGESGALKLWRSDTGACVQVSIPPNLSSFLPERKATYSRQT